jgi:predicted Zn-dependent protease
MDIEIIRRLIMLKNKKINNICLSLFTASVIGTSSCAMTGSEIVQRAAGAAINAGSAYLIPISAQDEIQIGQQEIRQVASEFKEYTANPALVSYVRSVGANLVKNATRKNELNYQFYVLDSPVINAFTIPGGSVFITTELLKYINNEAELAAVLGHEIGHNEKKHPVTSIRRAMAAQGLAQGALREGDSALVQIIASTTLNLILNGYSRAQEKEADTQGVLLSTKLGYSPQALTGFLKTLSDATGGEPSKLAKYFQTHPGSNERIANINNFIAQNHITVSTPFTNQAKYKQFVSVLPAKVDQKKVNNANPQ